MATLLIYCMYLITKLRHVANVSASTDIYIIDTPSSAPLPSAPLLGLLPVCHYAELPACDTEKQKRHPRGLCSALDDQSEESRVSGTKISQLSDLRRQDSALNELGEKEHKEQYPNTHTKEPLVVHVLMTNSGFQYACFAFATSCTLLC